MSKRVLITGAAGGIGAAAAEKMRAQGARVVGLDLEADPERDILACDVTDPAAVERAVVLDQTFLQTGGRRCFIADLRGVHRGLIHRAEIQPLS